VDGNPVQPGRERAVAAERWQRADRTHPRLLRIVLRECIIAREAAHDGVHARRIARVQLADGGTVTLPCPGYALRIGHALTCSGPCHACSWDAAVSTGVARRHASCPTAAPGDSWSARDVLHLECDGAPALASASGP